MSRRRESALDRLAFFIRRRRFWEEGGLVVFREACVEERRYKGIEE